MLEVKSYPIAELSAMFGTSDSQGLMRRLNNHGIEYEITGRGRNAVYQIHSIRYPFRVFCITELNAAPNTDFRKMRNFYYYYFNDEEFMAMPDEVKEHRMRENGRDISRQTIAGYTRKLVRHNLIMPDTANYIYYFAYKDTQRFVEKEEYLAAWHEYWRNKEKGFASWEAICMMRHKYKGVARKQAIPEINCIYNREIDYMLSAIQTEMEYELDTGFKL